MLVCLARDGLAVGGEGAIRGSGSGGVGAGSKEGCSVALLAVVVLFVRMR
jgi:hypothetical protein